MSKDENWIDNHTIPQEEWQKEKARRFKAECEGRICPICDAIADFVFKDEKETKYYGGPVGAGVHGSTTITWHCKYLYCPKCGYDKLIDRWKDKSPWEKFVDWFNNLF